MHCHSNADMDTFATKMMHIPTHVMSLYFVRYKVRVLTTRCYTWSLKQWNEHDDDEDENGRPSEYLLFILILKAFYAIQDEKEKRQLKRLKSYVLL